MKHLLAALCLLLSAAAAQAQQTTFTFQGRLDNAGVPASGMHDIRVTPFDAASGGASLAATVCTNDVVIDNGLFTIELPTAFTASGSAYLEVQVREDAAGALGCNNSSGYTVLTPRMAVTPAPTAAFAFAIPTTAPELPGAVRYNQSLSRFEGFVAGFWTPFLMGDPLAPANTQTYSSPTGTTFVVPAGVTMLGADVWGAGGGGGGLSGTGTNATGCPLPQPSRGGGGGGGGGAYARVSIPVTPGESLLIFVGTGGNAGVVGSGGVSGTLSRILRGATLLVSCPGGTGGGMGNFHSSSTTSPSLSGLGGNGGTAPTIASGVTALSSQTGNAGGFGLSPACTSFPSNYTAATNGFAAGGRNAGAPLPVVAAGAGGFGAVNATQASNGAHGSIRLFWN